MLVTAEVIALREKPLAPGKVHAALRATHHVLGSGGRRRTLGTSRLVPLACQGALVILEEKDDDREDRDQEQELGHAATGGTDADGLDGAVPKGMK
jgi:hypothetical protein